MMLDQETFYLINYVIFQEIDLYLIVYGVEIISKLQIKWQGNLPKE